VSLTVAIVDMGSGLVPDIRRIHPVLSHVAGLFARRARALVVPWHRIVIARHDVEVLGQALRVEADGRAERVDGPFAVDALWFYPVVAETAPAVNEVESAALEQMRARGIAIGNLQRNDVIAHLLLEASRRGVVTNAPGPLGRWGRKDQLEYALRWYSRVAGRRIPRPETHPIVGAQLASVLASFAGRGLDCILKPANGARGEGVRFVAANGAAPPVPETEPLIAQELVGRPLLLDGFKTDLRAYLLVDGADRACSGRAGPVLVRVAGARYERLCEASEITNTSYRRRAGMQPGILPLAHVDAIGADRKRAILDEIEALATDLLDAVFRWKELRDWRGNRSASRLLVWGLDVIVTEGEHPCRLLEVNVYPQLYRGEAVCDGLVDELLLREYWPALERSCARRRPARTAVAG
jgi:Tubulin-tyrosine ligase family